MSTHLENNLFVDKLSSRNRNLSYCKSAQVLRRQSLEKYKSNIERGDRIQEMREHKQTEPMTAMFVPKESPRKVYRTS